MFFFNYFFNKNKIEKDPYVYIEKNIIPKEKCVEIINLFLNDPLKSKGETISGLNTNIKNTNEISISRINSWNEINKYINITVEKSFKTYIHNLDTNIFKKYKFKNNKEIIQINHVINHFFSNNICINDFNLKEYECNKGFYVWHVDQAIPIIKETNHVRLVSFIIYLNDVFNGGETVFLNGTIKPEFGKIVFFPSSWTYLHKGNVPISNNKYIINGWISYNM